MGQGLFIVLALFFSFQILTRKGDEKILWFLAGILFFPEAIILFDSPVRMTFPRFLIYTILISTVTQYRTWCIEFKNLPIRASLVFILIMLICIGLFDPRLTIFLKLYRPLTSYFENFFILFATYLFVRNTKDVLLIYKTILLFFFVFCLYGILNYITRNNEYYAFITNLYGSTDFSNSGMNDFIGRFRVSSFAWHAIYYGFLLSIPIYICIYFIYFTKLNRRESAYIYMLIFLLLINLFLANSRTPLLSLGVGIFLLICFGMNFRNRVKIFAIGGLAIFLAINALPSSTKILIGTFDTFTSKGSNIDGSSLDMRVGQMYASLALFKKSPITGNGLNYITEGLGFSTENSDSDEELMGFESYSYKLLIEQGLCGIIGNIILFASILIFFYKNLNAKNFYSAKLSILSISMLATFLVFIFGTGDMGLFTFFMAIMGINIKAVQLFKMESQHLNEF